MKYYRTTDTEVSLWRRVHDEWVQVIAWPTKQAALRGLVAYNLWCEFNDKESSWYAPWAIEGGDLNDLERYYPMLDTTAKIIDPSPAIDYRLQVKSSMDTPTQLLEEMCYMSDDWGTRHLAALELATF